MGTLSAFLIRQYIDSKIYYTKIVFYELILSFMNTKHNNLWTQNETIYEHKTKQFLSTKRNNLWTLNETIHEWKLNNLWTENEIFMKTKWNNLWTQNQTIYEDQEIPYLSIKRK